MQSLNHGLPVLEKGKKYTCFPQFPGPWYSVTVTGKKNKTSVYQVDCALNKGEPRTQTGPLGGGALPRATSAPTPILECFTRDQ